MEKTINANDYIMVNKFLYGVKIPNYKNDIPVIGQFYKKDSATDLSNLYSPLKAFKSFSREDIVVFKFKEVSPDFLVKRIIGLPGDTIQIKNSNVYINNIQLLDKNLYSYNYKDISENLFYNIKTFSNQEYEAFDIEKKSMFIKNIKSQMTSYNEFSVFPPAKQNEWTRDNYGPLIIPKKGQTITISVHNYEFYESLIANYENVNLAFNKSEQIKYTFKNNYYFMMGDNRHNSIDSRSYGPINENFIQGKVITTF